VDGTLKRLPIESSVIIWNQRSSTIDAAICGLVVVATKMSFFAKSASIYWEYVGGLMILVGIVRLLWGLVKDSKNTKPGFW